MAQATTYWVRYVVEDVFGNKTLSSATAVTTLPSPSLVLPAPMVTSVDAARVLVRWPAQPAWCYDSTICTDDGQTDITLMACNKAEICPDQVAASSDMRVRSLAWGQLGTWQTWNSLQNSSARNKLVPSTSYWLRYLVRTRWGDEVWSPATFIIAGVALPGAGTQQPTASPRPRQRRRQHLQARPPPHQR